MAATKPLPVSNPDRAAAKCNFVAQDQIWWVYTFLKNLNDFAWKWAWRHVRTANSQARLWIFAFNDHTALFMRTGKKKKKKLNAHIVRYDFTHIRFFLFWILEEARGWALGLIYSTMDSYKFRRSWGRLRLCHSFGSHSYIRHHHIHSSPSLPLWDLNIYCKVWIKQVSGGGGGTGALNYHHKCL